jgi:hypothetical protein
LHDQRTRRPRRQLLEEAFHRRDIGEAMQTLAIDAQLARGLRAAQHQRGQDRRRLRRHLQDALEVVGVARHPTPARLDHQVRAFQAVEGRLHLGIARVQHGRAARLLVAPRHQRVQRQRIAVGNGVALFRERPQDASFEERKRAHAVAG